jgi:hypothetical protein
VIRDVTIPARECRCDKCGHSWISIGESVPTHCRNRNCRSREWNGKKQEVRSHRNEIKLPAPRSSGRPKHIAWAEEETG